MGNEKETSHIFKDALFLKIFQSFRISIQPSKLIIAFMAVAAICLAGWLMDFSESVLVMRAPRGKVMVTELDVYIANPAQFASYLEKARKDDEGVGVFFTLWRFGSKKFHDALTCLFAFNITGVVTNIAQYFQAIIWAVRYHWVYCFIFFLIKLVVISIAGGAICRIAALQFAQGEKPGLIEALRYSINKFTSFVTSPLILMVIIIIMGLFISLLGLVGNLRWAGELIVAIFMLLALFAGAVIAVFSIGTVAGFNLLFPAVAYDGSDCLDAISRSLSYVYARPWRMGFYTAIAAVYGSLCYIFVRFFAFLLLWCTHMFLQLGLNDKKLATIWPAPTFMNLVDPPNFAAANWSETVAALLIYLLVLAVVVLVVSYIISFYFSANTIIYSLMRKKVDNTALEDVYTISEEINIEPAMIESEPEEEDLESAPEGEPESESETEPESESEKEEDESSSKEP